MTVVAKDIPADSYIDMAVAETSRLEHLIPTDPYNPILEMLESKL
jgi:hypothetical protein